MKTVLMGNTHVVMTSRDPQTNELKTEYVPAPDGEAVNTTFIPDEWTLAETVSAFTRDNGIHYWQWADDDYPEWIASDDHKLARLIAQGLELKAAMAEPSQDIIIEVRTLEVSDED